MAEEAFGGLRQRASAQDVRLDILSGFLPVLRRDEALLADAAFLCRQRARRRAQPPQTPAQAEESARTYRAAAVLLEELAVDLTRDVEGAG